MGPGTGVIFVRRENLYVRFAVFCEKTVPEYKYEVMASP